MTSTVTTAYYTQGGIEEQDDYPGVLLRWDHGKDRSKGTRVIECADQPLWGIQHKSPCSTGNRWRTRYFCRNRATVEYLLPGKVKQVREALPEAPAGKPS